MQTMTPTGLVLPRFGTSRNYGRPTYGHEVGEVARRLGKPLMPWQQYAVDVALEYDPTTGDLWYEEVDITVPRQSGKTTLILALFVWRCVYMAQRIGPQTCTYLAQSGKMARRKLEREFIPIMRRSKGLREVPHSRARPVKATDFKPSMNNGSEHILFGTDSYLQIEAPTETGSHGDVLDMPVIDEAFSHQGDLVEQAVDAASVTRRSPQLYVVSTAGNDKSPYLYRKVLAGRAAADVGDPDSRVCYLEWSLPEDTAYDDEEAWLAYLPALGHTITLERLRAKLEKALRNPDSVDEDGDDPGLAGFRRGYLNQWVKVPQLSTESRPAVFTVDKWESLGRPPTQTSGVTAVGVGVGHNGATASIVTATRTPDGSTQFEVLESASGTWWLERRLMDLASSSSRPSRVGWNHGGPARPLAPELLRGARGIDADRLSGREWTAACEAFRRLIDDGRARHLNDPIFNAAILSVDTREVGAGFEWDLPGATADIAPVEAATAALRSLETALGAPPARSKTLGTRSRRA